MTYHLLNGMRRALGSDLARSTMTSTVAPLPSASDAHTVDTILDQISEALHILGEATSAATEINGAVTAVAMPRIQPAARQAEVAMHQLRALGWARSSAATELSQSLTVVVLLTDLIASGQITDEAVLDSYDLLARNIARAGSCVRRLRAPA